mmetsp:Transcript_24953/g.42751  ORF Transcript_24953/g.42751 Transcript_24953/m.42751 type:complete len:260 (+) Transcript_24953:370-1149(+)
MVVVVVGRRGGRFAVSGGCRCSSPTIIIILLLLNTVSSTIITTITIFRIQKRLRLHRHNPLLHLDGVPPTETVAHRIHVRILSGVRGRHAREVIAHSQRAILHLGVIATAPSRASHVHGLGAPLVVFSVRSAVLFFPSEAFLPVERLVMPAKFVEFVSIPGRALDGDAQAFGGGDIIFLFADDADEFAMRLEEACGARFSVGPGGFHAEEGGDGEEEPGDLGFGEVLGVAVGVDDVVEMGGRIVVGDFAGVGPVVEFFG